jgi:hypothetical protein
MCGAAIRPAEHPLRPKIRSLGEASGRANFAILANDAARITYRMSSQHECRASKNVRDSRSEPIGHQWVDCCY